MSLRHPSTLARSLWAALLLATPLLEAGHEHGAGLQAPDCVQCQFEGSKPVAGAHASPLIPSIAGTAELGHVESLPAREPVAPAIRGPPVLSS